MKSTCPVCGRTFRKTLKDDEAVKVESFFRNGSDLVQNVFPGWSNADREQFLKSGVCTECWNRTMGEIDECSRGRDT